MFNRFFSLLWLRYRYLLNNKMILFVCVFTPIVDFSVLNFVPDVRGSIFLMSMAVITIYNIDYKRGKRQKEPQNINFNGGHNT